ncbi:MAG: Type 1 phosphatases regulator ypi1, partial [Candelina submexicana]
MHYHTTPTYLNIIYLSILQKTLPQSPTPIIMSTLTQTLTPTPTSTNSNPHSTVANEQFHHPAVGILTLRGAAAPEAERRRGGVRWAGDVIDNEGMGRRRSKGSFHIHSVFSRVLFQLFFGWEGAIETEGFKDKEKVGMSPRAYYSEIASRRAEGERRGCRHFWWNFGVCCIYHKPCAVDESSDESSDSSSSDSDSEDGSSAARGSGGARRSEGDQQHSHGREGVCSASHGGNSAGGCTVKGKGRGARMKSPNAYEKMPRRD